MSQTSVAAESTDVRIAPLLWRTPHIDLRRTFINPTTVIGDSDRQNVLSIWTPRATRHPCPTKTVMNRVFQNSKQTPIGRVPHTGCIISSYQDKTTLIGIPGERWVGK